MLQLLYAWFIIAPVTGSSWVPLSEQTQGKHEVVTVLGGSVSATCHVLASRRWSILYFIE
jgi:hypothetical protein